jgi:hypothetical protein
MQPLSIFIVESQTAKRRFLKMFELPDDSGSQLERTEWFRVVKNGGSFSPNRGGAIRLEVAGINRALLQ